MSVAFNILTDLHTTTTTNIDMTSTVSPMHLLANSPESDEHSLRCSKRARNDSEDDSDASSAPQQKKPRKKWGQPINMPNCNLPPRKRAKTEEEKQQRRMERIVRNRKAASASRERKKNEFDIVKDERDEAVAKIAKLELQVESLKAQFEAAMQAMAVNQPFVPPPPLQLQEPIAAPDAQFSPQTFDAVSQEQYLSQTFPTFDLSSFVSEPLPETVELSLQPEPILEQSSALPEPASSDLTQHPAVVLCDLQCQSEVTQRQPEQAMIALLQTTMMALELLTSSRLSLFLWTTFRSVKTGLPIPNSMINSPLLLAIIQWLVTSRINPLTAKPSRTALLSNNIFRTELLFRILLCNPELARPLRLATLRSLQAASTSTPAENDDSRLGSEDGLYFQTDWAASMAMTVWTEAAEAAKLDHWITASKAPRSRGENKRLAAIISANV